MKKNKVILIALLAAAFLGRAYAVKVPAGADRAELTLPDGFRVSAELALTPDQQAKGLMFRPSLAPGAGMLFVFKDPGMKSFWMKNTIIDLDMVFLDAGLKVVGYNKGKKLAEAVVLQGHPWFVGVQSHPEFKSRPTSPQPLFAAFIGACIKAAEAKK